MEEEIVNCDNCEREMKEIGDTGNKVHFSKIIYGTYTEDRVVEGIRSEKLYQCMSCKNIKIA